MSGVKASNCSALQAIAFYQKQLWPASQGYVAWGVDPGIQQADSGSGTSRTSTLTAWASTTNQNGGTTTWTESEAVTVNWTSVSSSSGPFGVPNGGADEASRNAAIFGAGLQLLNTALVNALGGVS
jgi:hypothetical protein